MYLGRFRLGETVRVPVLGDRATASYDVNTPPVCTIYDGSGAKVLHALMPPADPYGAAKRLFALLVRLGSAFAAGRYRVAFNFTTADETTGLKVAHFDVVPGGNAAGNVIAMAYYQRPQATWLVLRTDADTRVLARNPYQ